MVAINGKGRKVFLREVSRFNVNCERIFGLKYIFNQGVEFLEGGCDTLDVNGVECDEYDSHTSFVPVSSAPSRGLYIGMDTVTQKIVISVSGFVGRPQIARVF